MLGGERLHRLDLAPPVDERAVEAPGEGAVAVDAVAGPDPAVHPQHLGQRLDDAVAGGADDEGRAAGVLVPVDLLQHLRVDARQDRRQDLRVHPFDGPHRDAGDQFAGDPQDLGGALVGRPPQAVPQVLDRPAEELPAADDAVPRGDAGELHPARPRHQGLVQVEERSGALQGVPFPRSR